MIHWLARENGFVHVCGHRGHSIGTPENTAAAIRATKDFGGSTVEIDCVLTADDEIILLHDQTLDRTTNGKGLAAAKPWVEIQALDAGAWFSPVYAGEPVPTLTDTIRLAQRLGMGLVVEIKERRRVDRFLERLDDVLTDTAGHGQVIVISFDHMVLKHAKARIPGLRTEGITHARHADIVGVARAAGLDSVSIEHMMFRPEDAEALHAAGVAIRLHVQRPEWFTRELALGLDHRPQLGAWLGAGLADSLSGDDVAWLAALVAENPLAG